MGKKKAFSRIVYGLVGLSSISGIIFMVSSWSTFWTTMGWTAIPFLLLVIGGLNWGIVAITGNRNKDLFGTMGL